MRRRLALTATTALLLVPASAAHAAFVAGTPIDGPTPELVGVSDLDVARDGGGAVAYVKRDGGVDHVFVARLVAGVFQAPERVDGALPGPSSQPVVAASDGGRLAVLFVNGGQVVATVRPSQAAPWTPATPLAANASDPSVDMSINGVGWATFTTAGNVMAARLNRNEAGFTVLPVPLDIVPEAVAGTGTGRSRVAVSADGTALVVWGESGHVFSRRVFNGSVSTLPAQLDVASFDGRAGGTADAPVVGIEDDSSFAWVAFRQGFADGAATTTRVLARRLRGSRYEEPLAADGLGWGGPSAALPDLALSGRGGGQVSVPIVGGGPVATALIKDDKLNPGQLVTGVGGVAVADTIAESLDRVVAWSADDGTVRARFFDDRLDQRALPPAGPEALLSVPALGPVDRDAGLVADVGRLGDTTVVFVQGGPDGRRLVAAGYDRPPGIVGLYTGTAWRRGSRPLLRWSASTDLGGVSYRVEVGGTPVGTTTDTRLTPAAPIPDGQHLWRVVAIDRAGQETPSRSRLLRIDATAPSLSFRVRRTGAVAAVTVTASDVARRGVKASGLQRVRIAFGDGSRAVTGKKASHRYRRKGRFTVRVSATDRAGNAVAVTRRITVR